MFKQQQINMAALYCRLSRDDGGDAESNSIITQRQMLQRYAKDEGFSVYDEYVDDGISGTVFDRPSFKRMITDIEDGKIGIVLCKDMSRLGRNNAMVAYYTEIFFPDNDVRFIAISDCIDTHKGENEIMAFKSVINEYYARDISKKIKAAYKTKALNGEFTASYAPYGYKKNPDNKHQLIPDENTAGTVNRIFQMAADGMTPFRISTALSKEGILTPRAYIADQYGKYKDCFHPKYPTDWNNTTIMTILQNRAYIGHLVCNKSTTKSFKNRKQIANPENDWIIRENTHDPIVDEYLFNLAQKVVRVRKCKNSIGEPNVFAGLLKCSDCGGGLCYIKPKNDGHKGSYNCNLYRKRTTKYCTAHYITHDALYKLILDDIRRNAELAQLNKDELDKIALDMSQDSQREQIKRLSRELDKTRKRDNELKTIIKKLFEKNALGDLTDEQFAELSAGYNSEQEEIKSRLAELQKMLDEQNAASDNTIKFLNIVRKYADVRELDANILNDLIDSIVIYNAEGKNRKNRVQQVDINYKFIGNFGTA